MHRMGDNEIDPLNDLPCGNTLEVVEASPPVGSGEHFAHHPFPSVQHGGTGGIFGAQIKEGVIQALRDKGAGEGSLVRMGEWEFDFIE